MLVFPITVLERREDRKKDRRIHGALGQDERGPS
jgi:hypothetical protein